MKLQYKLITIWVVNFFCAFIFILNSIASENNIEAIANNISNSLFNLKISSIAVVDFIDLQGQPTALGKYFAEELSVSLAIKAQGYNVIDRGHLKTIMDEHKLSSDGLVDPKTAIKLGKISGVTAIITGIITVMESEARVSVKVLDTETAKIVTAASINITLDPYLLKLSNTKVDNTKVDTTNDNKEITKNENTNDLLTGIEIEPKEAPLISVANIKITNMELLPNGTIEANFILLNKSRKNILLAIFDLFNSTFISDSKGNKYYALGCEGIEFIDPKNMTARLTEFPCGVPMSFRINFQPINKNSGTLFFSTIFNFRYNIKNSRNDNLPFTISQIIVRNS